MFAKSSHHAVHLKLTQGYVSILTNKTGRKVLKIKKKKSWKEVDEYARLRWKKQLDPFCLGCSLLPKAIHKESNIERVGKP